MKPHCESDHQFELFDDFPGIRAEASPRLELPFQLSQTVDIPRVRSIFGVSESVVMRMLEQGALRRYRVDTRWRIEYDSVIEYCNRLRVHYLIGQDRLLRKPKGGRLRDSELLPFPLKDTIYAPEVQERLAITRANVICLIEEGVLVGYQVLIDTKASPWRIYGPSLDRYLASLHAQAAQRSPHALS